MEGPSPSKAMSQLNRVAELSPNSEPSMLFLIGAGGSGKSTLAKNVQDATSSEKIGIVKFDDGHELGMDRWENHLEEFEDQESCMRAFVGNWVDRVVEHHSDKKLLICDINTTPDILRQVLTERPELKASIILVQPSEEVRVARLANDPSREHMSKEALLAQFDSGFADFLSVRSEQLGIPRVYNEQPALSIVQVADAATRLLKNVP